MVANAFEHGVMFQDLNGNVYLRCDGGCIRINEDAIQVFTNEDMGDFNKFSMFECCAATAYDININIEHN
jgi:hypothetical protein